MVTLFVAAVVLWIVLGTWALVRRAGQPPAESFGSALAHGLPTDPAEAGFAFETMSYAHGLDVWHVQGDRPDGPVTILLHDWGHSPITELEHLSRHMATSSEVLLPTLRGHGPPSGRCTLGPREIEDIDALLDTLDGPIVLYGRGLGGLIAVALAHRSTAHVTEAWADTGDGLRRILARSGQPPFPFAWTGRICFP
jgi:pimeloyl-ACP methyl ester carboxylesterase